MGGSIFDDFLGVGAEEAGRRGHLGGVDLDAGVFLELGEEDLLLDGEELVEVEVGLVDQLLADGVLGLGLRDALLVLLERDLSVLRLVGLEGLADHQHLFLGQALVHVFLHLEIRVH